MITPKSLVDVANDSHKKASETASQDKIADASTHISTPHAVGGTDNVPVNKSPSLMDVAKGHAKPALTSLVQVAQSNSPPTTVTTTPSLMSVAANNAPKTLQSTVEPSAPRKSLAASVAATASPSDSNALVAVATKLREDPTSTFGKSVELADVAAKMDKERAVEISLALQDASVAVKAESDAVAQQVLPQLVKEVNQQVDTIKIDPVKAALSAAAMEVKDEAKVLAHNQTAAVLQACATEVKQKAAVPIAQHLPSSPTYSQGDDFEDEESVKSMHTKKAAAVNNQSEEIAEIERTSVSTDKSHREFLLAVFRGNMQKVRSMMDADADLIHATDQHGWNALHWAASQGHGDVLKYLLQKGAIAHAAEPVNLWSPLHVAVIRAHVACVKLLMDNGAMTSVKQKDVYGDRPVDCAANLAGRRRIQILATLNVEGKDT
ncbi:hypothetical protein DYB32_009534 [Aphanomyces invadans]|uniref:Uncharacterized protein n=1 Tax=Aphanomyces invadans TaxID=157072 RepID=A0A3R6WF73_9STRA|nr:hypothetical protein DYB32_009534 [Aphanomyces invadans]